MAFEVARVFAKRETEKSDWDGRIGKAELFVSDDGVWSIDGKVLPRVSIEYLLNFSLQSLQDAYAGAKSLKDAIEAWEKKRDSLIEGTIGVRTGDGETIEQSAERFVAKQAFMASSKVTDEAKAAFKEKSKEDQRTFLDALFAKNAAALAGKREERIAELKARAKKVEVEIEVDI